MLQVFPTNQNDDVVWHYHPAFCFSFLEEKEKHGIFEKTKRNIYMYIYTKSRLCSCADAWRALSHRLSRSVLILVLFVVVTRHLRRPMTLVTSSRPACGQLHHFIGGNPRRLAFPTYRCIGKLRRLLGHRGEGPINAHGGISRLCSGFHQLRGRA